MRAGRIVVAVVAALVALAAIGLFVGGGALIWAHTTQRDGDGFLTSPTYDLTTEGYAITTSDLDLATEPGEWWPDDLAEVRLDATAGETGAVFVGIGPADDVAGYLDGVAYDEIIEIGDDPSDVTYAGFSGSAPATPPGEQPFWVASVDGTGTQTLTWEVTSGEWAAVVMNASGAQAVVVDATAGVKVDILLGVGIGLMVGGLLIGAAAAAMLVWATRATVEERAAAALRTTSYPVALQGELDPQLSRWMWLVKWFLAIPHYVALMFLWAAFAILTLFAFFAILFTGRYPRGIFDFNVGVMRWSWRVGFYSSSALGTDQYPPFTLRDVDYPARFDVEYPEQLSRGLALVKWWLLAIPHYLIVGLFTSGLVWWASDVGGGDVALEIGGGLIGLLVIIAGFALAFTGQYPRGLFDLVMGLNRWVYRVAAYVALMRDEYPPFRLDLGGDEPGFGPPVGPSGPAETGEALDVPSESEPAMH